MATNVIKLLRSLTRANRPTGRVYGEPYVNLADGQLGVINSTGGAQDLIGVPIFSTTATYVSGQVVNFGGAIYSALGAITTPGAWNASQWSIIPNTSSYQSWTQSYVSGAYLPLTGGTITGYLSTVTTGTTWPTHSFVKPASGTACQLSSYTITSATSGLRWVQSLGDSSAESGSNLGSNLLFSAYSDTGAAIGTPLSIARQTGNTYLGGTAVYIQPTYSGVGNASFYMVKSGSGNANNIFGLTGSLARWAMVLGTTDPESGGTAGSNFGIYAYNDSGTQIGAPLTITRSTGNVNVNGGGLTIQPSWAAIGNANIQLTKVSTGYGNNISGSTGASQRWTLILGSVEAETGSNAGSNFAITRYNDAGVGIDVPFSINRSTGFVQVAIQGIVYSTWGNHNIGFAWTGSVVNYYVDGTLIGAVSDARIKNVIGDYKHGLTTIEAMRPVRFKYKANDTPAAPPEGETAPYSTSLHYNAAIENHEVVGLIAQDVEAIAPELVSTTTGYIDGEKVDDFRQLDTAPLIFALVNAVKELSATVKSLQTKVDKLEKNVTKG